MKLPLFQLDAFTDRRFGGNPAAVVLLDEWLPDSILAAIAAENNLPETAFVVPVGEVMPLRWFTPTEEIDLCGHATLATAQVLFNDYLPMLNRVRFSTRSGELAVGRVALPSGKMGLQLDFPARPGRPVAVDEAMVAALGARPQAALKARDLMLVFASEAEVRALQPDFARVAALDAMAVIATAPGETVDFVSRFFAPGVGIDEDPVTGSAHCTLIPYWAARLGKPALTAKQVSARGGELFCELQGERVLIAGSVVEYLRGEISLD
ncbi:MAG: PhzF family phenazine biosynthesis protein [Betaproteobacteria bacterium]